MILMKRCEIFLMCNYKMKLTNTDKKRLYVALLIAIVLVIFYKRSGKSGKSYTIYGSESCPWTVKALDVARNNGHSFEYVDCKKGNCPSFVSGFPTYKNHSSGNVSAGFTEDPHAI